MKQQGKQTSKWPKIRVKSYFSFGSFMKKIEYFLFLLISLIIGFIHFFDIHTCFGIHFILEHFQWIRLCICSFLYIETLLNLCSCSLLWKCYWTLKFLSLLSMHFISGKCHFWACAGHRGSQVTSSGQRSKCHSYLRSDKTRTWRLIPGWDVVPLSHGSYLLCHLDLSTQGHFRKIVFSCTCLCKYISHKYDL